ncbi:hypothetical protein [Methylocaldum sp.]|uniref:hypothetical protein n=1 Tax=Methylocaldum sp. TaxID=1969727 RepID=UPI002D6F83BB|nr:hypothetical protein [Methylocaldum sp.]HYE34386.1 hypothetical protein [Methylocaldum sp.]
MTDLNKNSALNFIALSQEGSYLSIEDPKTRDRAFVGTYENNQGFGISLFDERDIQRTSMGFDRTSSIVSIWDRFGNASGLIRSDEAFGLYMGDKLGRNPIVLTIGPDGKPAFQVTSKTSVQFGSQATSN